MRLSTQQIHLTGLNGILDNQMRLQELQQQITTGKRVATPADDPVASASIVNLEQKLAQAEQYRNNASLAESKLRLEETTLDTIKEVLQQARELTIKAGDGAMSHSDRLAISGELKQQLQQLVGLANTRDSSNQYIFGGFQAGQQPIVADDSGGYSYRGDDGQLFIQVAENLTVAASDPGDGIFMDVDQPLNFSATTNPGNSGTLVLDEQTVAHQETFDNFHPDAATITFSEVAGELSYTVTRVSDGSIISGGQPSAPLANVPYNDAERIEFAGMRLAFSGTPAAGDTIDIASLPPAKEDIFSAIEQFTVKLPGASQSELGEVVADMLLSLDNALDNVLETQVAIGGRLNTIDDARASHDNQDIIGRQVLSDLQELDYAEALSKLALQQFVLEATQRTFVQVSNLSLFNFLR